MYLMYVDESGDCGMVNSPTDYFFLTGLIIHETKWKEYINKIIEFRKRMRRAFGLRMREEIHAVRFMSRPGKALRKIKKNDRLSILRFFLKEITSLSDLRIITIYINKNTKPPDYDIFNEAWKALIQRFENTIEHKNFPGPEWDHNGGIIITDNTSNKRLKKIIRKMHRFNPISHDRSIFSEGYRDIPLKWIVEDPHCRNSEDSYFIQAADLLAYFTFQRKKPCLYIKQGSTHKRIDEVYKTIGCGEACRRSKLPGIVPI